MKKVLFCAFVASIAGGCAAVDSGAPATEREEVTYRTGSNIPTRAKSGEADGVRTYDKDAIERGRYESPPVPRPGIPGSRPGG